LMTGRHLYGIEKKGWQAPISGNTLTIPEVFKNAGYVTFGTGKQHNGKDVFARGFSEGGEISPVSSAAKSGMYLGNARKFYTKKDADYWENKRR